MHFTDLRLQTKHMIGSTFLIVFLMVCVILIIENRQSYSLTRQTEKRGLAIANSISVTITTHLLSYDYIGLQHYADKAVREEDMRYVIILDKERNVAAWSGHPDRQGAAQADIPEFGTYKTLYGQGRILSGIELTGENIKVMDIAVPVYIEDPSVQWGTVRIGLSLATLKQNLFQTRLLLYGIGLVAVFIGLGGAALLSGRITKPIHSLAAATKGAAQGDLQQHIDFRSGDELGQLGRSFNVMIANLRTRTEELVRMKNNLDLIIASSPDAITVADAEGHITIFNEAAEKLTGYAAEDVQGKPLYLFYTDPRELLSIQNRLSREKSLRQYETHIQNRDGHSIPISLSLSLIPGKDGLPVGSVGISRDLREMKQLQKRLFQSERLAATAKLAASIAHEVSNPIYGIQNCIDLLEDDISPDSPRRKYLDLAKKEIERVATLVRQMVDFHRPVDEPFRPIALHTLLTEILILEEKRFRNSHITVTCDFQRNLPAVLGAEGQLRQVFFNILINAREAMPDGGRVHISTGIDDAYVRIDVSDTGNGISETDLEHIFEPFYTTKAEVKGVGLGLSVSYGIIQKHDGKIDVQSTSGTGTTFSVLLPAHSPRTNSPTRS